MTTKMKINHLAIAVHDINEALTFWCDAMGLELSHIESVPSQNAEVAFIPIGTGILELVKPTSDDTGLAIFIKNKGNGIHHICIEVDDLDQMITQLVEKNIRLINEKPDVLEGRRIVFIHPKSASGVLVELCEIDKTDRDMVL
jgi:methylmalonyl-CoA/ethylmalonyl-CoA epimerase